MEYTEQQQALFKQQFAERRKRQILLAIPLGVVILAFTLLSKDKNPVVVPGLPPAAPAIVLFASVIAAGVFSLRNWRCPACDAYLGKGISPRFCPKCGVALQ